VSSSWRYFGCAVGFGFGVVWMTVGIGSAILVLLCAAFGFGVAFIAERERAGLGKLRPARQSPVEEEPLAFEEFELPRYARAREDDELAEEAMAPVAAEADYGWPAG
jgi:hypothetical protein